ncbi:hypothetical protein GGR54DRAFT_641143 [Hypoxylon sp. NC1633]|nr:hypothetical protein GGR54DRAFT_641143 [Hypoxylon sp. NC1633]
MGYENSNAYVQRQMDILLDGVAAPAAVAPVAATVAATVTRLFLSRTRQEGGQPAGAGGTQPAPQPQPVVQAIGPHQVQRTIRRGLLRSLAVRNNPSVGDFETRVGSATLARATAPETFISIAGSGLFEPKKNGIGSFKPQSGLGLRTEHSPFMENTQSHLGGASI